MVYVDTTLTPEATYTYVNARQVYDAVAGAMTTHTAWDFVEHKDAINGANTYRRYVWRCNAAQSGLSADFFVVFEVVFVTATGVWATATAVKVWLGETYTAGVLGKFATNATSVTLASDLTNPATFTLTTYAVPATLSNFANTTGPSSATSYRYWFLVAKDALVLCDPVRELFVVGAYESVMSLSVDPMPIASIGSGNPTVGGGATRAPTMTPGVAYTEVFAVSNSQATGSNPWLGGHSGYWMMFGASPAGTLGLPGVTTWYKNLGGPTVARLVVMPGAVSLNSNSTKGLFRGYIKYVYGASLATHSYGDTFIVDGKVYVGTGKDGPVVDTEAP